MKYYHHDHDHGHTHGEGDSALSEAEKARILLSHMLEHNTHHEEEMESLAARFEALGKPEDAEKIREAAARMKEANAALRDVLGEEA